VNIDLGKSLCEGLGISPGHVVSIAGAGGKTSLMYALGRELASAGHRVLLTTTTKLVYPEGAEVARVVLGPQTDDTLAGAKSGLESAGPVLVGREKQQSKIIGFSAWFVDALYKQSAPVTVIAECDGALGKSLKVPRGWEPVMPSATTVYVVVVGADCLGKRLGSGFVFEPEAVGALAGVEAEAEVDVRLVTRTVLAPESYADRKPDGARLCVFVNKWDTVRPGTAGGPGASEPDPALELGLELKKSAKVERVVLGSLKSRSQDPIMVIS
jgi:probable selenium-dependent hydroxylase accessory protein YqeC